MDRKTALKYFSEEQLDTASCFNPLEVLSNIEFDKKPAQIRPNEQMNYRLRSLSKAIKLHVPFHSTCNHIYDISREFIKVHCPYCYASMKLESGGGDCSVHTGTYSCECGSKVLITMPVDGVSVQPPPPKETGT